MPIFLFCFSASCKGTLQSLSTTAETTRRPLGADHFPMDDIWQLWRRR